MNNEEKILEILGVIQSDVSGLKTDVADLKTDVADLKTDVADLKTDVADLKTDVADLKTDVADLKTDVADLKTRVTKIEITQENVILPQLQTLAEGQANLLATLAPKSRVEALEDEMSFMKSVVKALSQEVAELKKAQ